jgi:hypothetical protein
MRQEVPFTSSPSVDRLGRGRGSIGEKREEGASSGKGGVQLEKQN